MSLAYDHKDVTDVNESLHVCAQHICFLFRFWAFMSSPSSSSKPDWLHRCSGFPHSVFVCARSPSQWCCSLPNVLQNIFKSGRVEGHEGAVQSALFSVVCDFTSSKQSLIEVMRSKSSLKRVRVILLPFKDKYWVCEVKVPVFPVHLSPCQKIIGFAHILYASEIACV